MMIMVTSFNHISYSILIKILIFICAFKGEVHNQKEIGTQMSFDVLCKFAPSQVHFFKVWASYRACDGWRHQF